MVGGVVTTDPPMARDMRGPIAPPAPAVSAPSVFSPATPSPAAVSAATPAPQPPLRGEITPTVPASGK